MHVLYPIRTLIANQYLANVIYIDFNFTMIDIIGIKYCIISGCPPMLHQYCLAIESVSNKTAHDSRGLEQISSPGSHEIWVLW